MKATFSHFLNILSLMWTAVWALGLLALASVVGTFVVQLTSYEILEARYGIFWAQVFDILQLDRLYSAWWFLGLAGFLVLSVSMCLFRNGPRLWRQTKAGKKAMPLTPLRAWPAVWEGKVNTEHLEANLKNAGFRKQKDFGAEGSYWVKSRLGRIGYFLTHGAVVLLSVGAILTGVFGYRLTLHLIEGEVYDFAAKWEEGAFLPQNLPFALKNNETIVEHYFTGMPRQFRTDLTLRTPDGEEKRTWLEVNAPVDFKGHRIYQADYGDGGSGIMLSLRPTAQENPLPEQVKGRTGFGEDMLGQNAINLTAHKMQPNTVLDLPQKAGGGRVPTNIGPSVEVVLETPTDAPRVLKLFLQRPWLIGFRSGPVSIAQIQEDITGAYDLIFLGLNPAEDAGWPLASTLVENTPPALKTPDALKAYYSEKLPQVAAPYLTGLPESERLRLGLGAVMAATAIQQLGLPFVPVLQEATFRPYSGVIIARDPGMVFFVLGGLLLVLGSGFMVYRPLVRLWVRQTPEKNVTFIAAQSSKVAALPKLEILVKEE